MEKHRDRTISIKSHDKQLRDISLDAVLEKRRLDQALNAKEFAVCAGISYSTARSWFRLPGFPVFHGVIFWQDFERWRAGENKANNSFEMQRDRDAAIIASLASTLPPRAAQILSRA